MTSGKHTWPITPLPVFLADITRFIRECRDGTADKRYRIYVAAKYRLDDGRRHVRPKHISRAFIRPGAYKRKDRP